MSISLDEVMRILHRKNKLLKSYIRVKDIKRFFLGDDLNPGEENEESYVVLRMLMQRYLRKDFFMHYTLSKNIRDGNSALYLSTARKFIYLFLQKWFEIFFILTLYNIKMGIWKGRFSRKVALNFRQEIFFQNSNTFLDSNRYFFFYIFYSFLASLLPNF